LNFKVGDYVRGISNAYMITDKNMTKAVVINVKEIYQEIQIEILEHRTQKGYIKATFWVTQYDFEKIENKTEDFLLKEG